MECSSVERSGAGRRWSGRGEELIVDWLAQNWFWLVLGGLFVWMMFGHSGGCCGGRNEQGGHQASGDDGSDAPQAHQH